MRLSSLSNICSPASFISDSGEEIKILYQGFRETPSSPVTLVPSGKLNIREYINSFGASTDMAYILSRLKAGDSSVLFCSPGMYGDSTVFPVNPAESLELINKASAYFDNLPDDLRSKFNNNFLDWIQSAGSEDWISKMAPSDSGVSGDVVPPVSSVPSDS